ncbi:MAG TPA: phytanoyl-CoA dioxygenase family protein, partial [Reyranella sp.]
MRQRTYKKLTPEQIARYERDGYICPVDAFPAERAHAWRERLEAFERAEGQKMTRGHNFKPHLLFPWVDEIVHAPEVLDAVEDLIGPDIRLFHLTVWPKDAGSGTYVSWHQDATYFALEPACHVTAWVAL